MHAIIARIKHYLGLDLPPRKIDLRFDLHPPGKQAKKPNLSSIGLRKSLRPLKDTPKKYFRLLLRQMKMLNRYPVGPSQRLARTALVLKWFHPLAMQTIYRFSKQSGIPESDERQELLDLISDIVRNLTVSYKTVFQHDYDASRFEYARSRNRIYFCAFRILELINFEQRIRGLRYQSLGTRAWQDANTVFHVMLAYESVEFQLPLLNGNQKDEKNLKTACLQEFYASIHAYALLDYSTWPTDQQSFIDTYRESVNQSITVMEDSGGALTKDMRIAYCYQDGPSCSTRIDTASDPAVLISFSVLAESIHRDFRDLIKAKEEKNSFLVPKILAPLKDVYRLALASLMHRNVGRDIWSVDASQPGEQINELRIYVGFRDIYMHLRGIFGSRSANPGAPTLADTLAERSAAFGEDHTATQQSLWHVLHSDNKKIRLRTQETCYSTPMTIGSLVAYEIGEADHHQPHLGWVSRIFRPISGTVIVEIERLANFAEPVKITKNCQLGNSGKAPKNIKTMLSFLVYDNQLGWGLLLPKQELFWEKTPVLIHRDKQVTEFELGNARSLTAHFHLFNLTLETKAFGSPDYPSSLRSPWRAA